MMSTLGPALTRKKKLPDVFSNDKAAEGVGKNKLDKDKMNRAG